MPPLSTKKQERLNQLLSVLEDGAVQPNELIEAVEAVMAILDMSHKDVLARLEETKKGASSEVQALANAVDQANSQIAGLIAQVREQGGMTAAEIKALVAAEVRRLEDSMPEMPEMPEGYDDEEIREHIAEHKQILDNLGFLITGENVRNALEVLPEGEKLAIGAIEGLEDALAKREQVRENTTALIVSRLDQISDVDIAGVTNGQVLAYNSTTKRWEPSSAGAGVVASIVAGTGIAVDSTDPANPIVSATGSSLGDMTAAVYDPAGGARQVAFADSVATAAQGALADSASQPGHTHVIADVTGLQTALDGKAATSHTHVLAAGATDVTATAAEVNVLDGITATTAELNYTDGVTSNIQTQLDARLTNNVTSEASSATPTATGDRQRNLHVVTALAANTVVQVPSGTAALGNIAKYTILNGGTIRTIDKHASVTDPYAFFTAPLNIPANGRADVLMEYNGTAWAIISATVTV